MASTWLTVSMTINRYAHLCHPMLGLRYFGVRFMIASITVSALFSLAFNLPRFWLYEIAYADCLDLATGDPFPVYGLGPGPMKANKTAEASYQWLYFFLGISIPLCILAYCNCRIIHAVYNSMAVEQRRNRERNLITKVLICIVIFYLLLVSPAEINKFFSSKITISKEHIQSYNFAVTMLNTFQAVNFSCNFIPYLVLDKKFRALLAGLFCRKKADSSSRRRSHYESVSLGSHCNSEVTRTQVISLGSNNFVPMYKMRFQPSTLAVRLYPGKGIVPIAHLRVSANILFPCSSAASDERISAAISNWDVAEVRHTLPDADWPVVNHVVVSASKPLTEAMLDNGGNDSFTSDKETCGSLFRGWRLTGGLINIIVTSTMMTTLVFVIVSDCVTQHRNSSSPQQV
ncbi:hypothetical protein LSH36_1025g01016 [Paralvinella palmiformis]|uniref:G-protein coupled receptors family 1 profile domain-containing protein n=1 Tax=Paralvinella palmiformis TaxID=53620 RepID=A0AAD9IWL0_9ANNE|nr:hypothetical protein LSH36_1025g01016 [Paralvinella palmiformis]